MVMLTPATRIANGETLVWLKCRTSKLRAWDGTRYTLHTAKNRECLWFARSIQDDSRAGGKGTFRQDVPIDELVEEKKAAETTTTPEPKAPASKEEETPANPKLEDEFYANMDEGHGFKSIKAKKVVIPGYEKFDLYLHHPASVDKKGEVVEDKDHWVSVRGDLVCIWVTTLHRHKLIGQLTD